MLICLFHSNKRLSERKSLGFSFFWLSGRYLYTPFSLADKKGKLEQKLGKSWTWSPAILEGGKTNVLHEIKFGPFQFCKKKLVQQPWNEKLAHLALQFGERENKPGNFKTNRFSFQKKKKHHKFFSPFCRQCTQLYLEMPESSAFSKVAQFLGSEKLLVCAFVVSEVSPACACIRKTGSHSPVH